MQPNAVTQALRAAVGHQQAGRLGEAEALFLQILRDHGDDFETLSWLALLYVRAGLAARVEAVLARAWPLPDDADANSLRRVGLAWRMLGQPVRAVPLYERLLATDPSNVDAMTMLADGYLRAGRLAEGAEWLKRAAELRPTAELFTDLGAALERLERRSEAEAAYRRAIELNANFAPAHSGLGAVLAAIGRQEEALAAQTRATAIDPKFTLAHVRRAEVAQRLGRPEEADAAARQALAIDPSLPAGHVVLGMALGDRGLTDLAAKEFETAAALWDRLAKAPGTPPGRAAMAGQERDLLAVAAATVLPEVYAAEADVDPWRQRLDRNLRALHDAGTSLPADRPPIATLFLLVYQGREDRALMEAFSRLFPTPAEPAAVAPAGGGRKIRVGFVSRNFYSHTVGTLNIGLVERLDREKFEVFVFCVGEYTDRLNARFRRAADRYVTLPLSLPAARDMVRSHACDILFYTDLGMDAVTYGMAHARLAPVQCTTWGHPVTSGSTTVDYFVSTAMAESADAQAHYTERLALLPRLSVYYTRPPAPPPADVRAELGLPADAHLYGCLQTVWKFHPEFDRLLAEVLRRDPAGQLLVIRSTNEDVERQRRERWERVMPDVAGRIRSLPRMPIADFLNVVRACDVLLDPIHFGGGNTTYEAFAFGVPVVTLPSPFLRGRFTLAMYRTLGVDDCVVSNAAEYVELAVRLANDPAYRSQVSGKILAAGDRLFQDESAVRAMEEFFESVARRQSRM